MVKMPTRYQPKDRFAHGGMSVVHFCTDSVLCRDVAIKFISQKTAHRRVLDEIKSLLKMRSKHVVQVFDIFKDSSGAIGIVQEFVSGKDLFDGYQESTSIDDYYKKIWQIAAGIADIHKAKIIHRDIKPNNIKVDAEGVIKIFDFGLAREDGIDASTVGFCGTQWFAAPEQYREPFSFTSAVDVYAFGVTALYLLSGTIPKEFGLTPPKLKDISYFSNSFLDIGDEVVAILDQCLDSVASKRPLMCDVKLVLERHLMLNKHRALVTYDNKATFIDEGNPNINLSLTSIGRISINYNGMYFVVKNCAGEVAINNMPVSNGDVLPGSCVVALGSASRKSKERAFITFDLSNPEIVL